MGSAADRLAYASRVFGRTTLSHSSYFTIFVEVTCAINQFDELGFYIVYRKPSGASHAVPFHFHPDDAAAGGAAVEMEWVLQGSDEG